MLRPEEFYQNQREYYRLRRLAFPEHFKALAAKSRPNLNLKLKKDRLARYNSSYKGRLSRQKYERSSKGRLSQQRYRMRHPDVQRASEASYRARRHRVCIAGNKKEIRQIYSRAKYFRQWFDVSVDHIIPMVKGGLHAPNNLQIIYRSENVRKRDSLNFTPSVIFI